MKIKHPIFIVGAPKSGTSLLRSLFDNHPELAVIPFETTIFHILGEEVNHPFRRNKANRFKLELFESFKKFEKIITEYNSSSFNYIDSTHLNKFQGNVIDYEDKFINLKNKKEIFSFLVEYLNKAYIGIDSSYFNNKRVVEKSIINHEFAFLLKDYFPNAKFIHIVRNPYANIVSLRNYKSKGKFPSLPEIFLTLENSYKYLFINRRNIDNYFVLKYEDLIQNPDEIMSKISGFLGIKYDPDILLHPTLMGDKWAGNSTSNKSFINISKAPMDHWKEYITPVEIYYANKLFGRIFSIFDYQKITKNGFLRINKGESVKTYVRNRLFKWYLNLL